ncbi:hypothetical protein A2U01_0093791, partial [Trifolium medium]|nr:hypothetical protein [Trifolium medium]
MKSREKVTVSFTSVKPHNPNPLWSNVLKPGPVINPVKTLGHWFTGQTSGSL